MVSFWKWHIDADWMSGCLRNVSVKLVPLAPCFTAAVCFILALPRPCSLVDLVNRVDYSTYPSLEVARVAVHFYRVFDKHDGSCEVIPGSAFSISRDAFKSNTSRYFIDDKPSNFTEVTTLLRDYGVDLDNNRFLILQVRQRAMWALAAGCESCIVFHHDM